MSLKDGILIINFGSQYTQLIGRRIREFGVYSEIYGHHQDLMQIIKEKQPKGIILSGGPASIYEKNAPNIPAEILNLGIPILGICYGMQLICHHLGAKVRRGKIREYGYGKVKFCAQASPLLKDMHTESQVWLSHGDEVATCPKGCQVLGRSGANIIAAIGHKSQALYGVQFHPETTHSSEGSTLLKNFAIRICKCKRTWKPQQVMETIIQDLKAKIGREKVILALSGGVDSSVAAMLIHQAIGKNLTCIFVDTGLLRKNEASDVMRLYKNKFNLNIRLVQAGHIFLSALQNVSDPEQKRKIIGELFIDIFEKEAKLTQKVRFLAQGTIYPDLIESANISGANVIKSHHNVGGLPQRMQLELIEPLRYLFKDEVRLIGKKLGLPTEILERHPSPGPGLAVRIIGNITKERIQILQQADAILIEELHKHKLYNKVSQAFVVLLPIRSVGVMGDKRTYEYVCAIRSVNTIDFMTASWTEIPYPILAQISSRITGEISGVNRAVYDITSKPPATIEWE